MISQRSAVAAFFLLIVLLAAGVPNLAPHQITSPSNSAFRLPVLPGVTVTVTQGNNQGDHIAIYGSQYAFDFIVGQQNFVITAAQAGTVIGLNDSSTIQCGGLDLEIAPESKPLKHCWAYANFVLIADDDGQTASLYVHLLPFSNNGQMPKVTIGEHVNQGDPIGLAGTTGWSSGVHLHFQVESLPSAAAQQSQQPPGWWWTNSLPTTFSNPEVVAQDADGVPQVGQDFIVSALPPTPTPTSTPIPTLTPTPASIPGIEPFVGTWGVGGIDFLTINTNGSATWSARGSNARMQFTRVQGNTLYGTVTSGTVVAIIMGGSSIPTGGTITVTLLDPNDVQVSTGDMLCQPSNNCAY